MSKTNAKSTKAKKPPVKATANISPAQKAAKGILKKKMKAKKLEDRIAPGMVGSGLVDPGAGDYQDGSQTSNSNYQDQSLETEVSATSSDGGDSQADQGQYIDDSSNYSTDSGGDAYADSDYSSQSENLNQDLSGFNSYEASSEPIDDAQAWKEPDWVTANADGSVHVLPPDGVTVDQGIANFPLSVANEELPIPEEMTLQADGSATVELPEEATFNAETNTLTMPAEGFNPQDVPEEMVCYQNPDGNWNIQLPENGVEYNSADHSLNINNEMLNEMAPNNIEINENGSVSMTLPEGTTINADGSWDMPQGASEFMDNPPPEELTSLEFAETHSDGSVSFELPQQAEMESGIVTFDQSMIDQLPVPDSMTIHPDGSMDIQLPEGCEYNADSGTLILPPGELTAQDIPEGIDYTVSAQGAYSITLPEGMNYSEGSLHCNNHWANEIAPDSVYIQENGAISVELPPGTDFISETQFTIPSGQTDFLQVSNPDYIHDTGFAEPQGDGSYQVVPPMGAEFTESQMHFTYEVAVETLPIPEHVTLNADGTLDMKVPEGTSYDAATNSLSFPVNSVQITEIPQGIDVSVSADGTIVAQLPEGIEYSNGSCHFDNYWANEFAPESVQIHADGSVDVKLPSDAEYQSSGAVQIPEHSADFVQNPEPAYVMEGPEWVEANPDGSVNFSVPSDITVDPNQGTMTMSVDQVIEHFDSQIPDDVTLNPDGTSDVKLPEGTAYNSEAQLLVMPAGSVNIHEIPAEVNAYIAPDGNICVPMQEGMSFQADTGSIHLDSYWTNELAPEAVQIHSDGSVEVTLPSQTVYHDDSSFNVPAVQADFIQTPEPTYITQGPEWINLEGNGSVTVAPPPGLHMDVQAGTITMPPTAVMEHFESQIPQDAILNPDGTMEMPVPQGTLYDTAANALTFPAGTVHLHDIPEGISASLGEQGQVIVTLPEGIEYSNGVCHFDNYWTNELAPEPVQIQSDGQVVVTLPSETHYHTDGSFSIPAGSADFMQTPEPMYVAQGPDWIEPSPTGGADFHPPTGVTMDPQSHMMSMSVDALQEHFETQIPDGITLHADGTMEAQVPEGTVYDSTANALTFPEGSINSHEIPAGIQTTMNADGTLTVQLPAGIEYNNGVCQFDNYWTNQMAPPHVEISPEGMVNVQMPSDSYVHADGSFSIPQGSTDFMHTPEPPYVAGGPDWASSNPDGSIAFTPPPGEFQMNPEAGTVSMHVDAMYEHFDHQVPQDVTFNSDGTMDVKLPEGTQFADGVLTFSADSMNINEIPVELSPYQNADGSVSVRLPEGANYQADTGSVHFNNQWTNTLTPDHMEVQPTGQVVMSLPPETQYYSQGVVIPAEQAYFAAPAEYQTYQTYQPVEPQPVSDTGSVSGDSAETKVA